jgi:rSAM/selenodomain-associated transferase 2
MRALSIVVPTLNEAGGLVAHLAALQPMRERGTEVVVVDGGSTDGTPALAAPWADSVVSAPRGRAAQMNAGAKLARGDVLLFLHADTRLPDAADLLLARTLQSPGRVWGRFDVEIEGTHPLLRIVAWSMNFRSRLTGIATGDQAIFARRHAFDAVGGFPAQPLMEDLELSTRLWREGRLRTVNACVTVSGRRFLARPVFYFLAVNGFPLLYRLGVSPATLLRVYAHVR